MQLTERGPLPPVDTAFIMTQVGFAGIFLAALVAAVFFVATRKRALSDLLLQLNRAQLSLAQEEERVRGAVFDHLHGSLQAEFVAMRHELRTLSETTSDPRAAITAISMDQCLERVYREGVESIARDLYPSGIEAGLNVALAELAQRVSPVTTVTITMDPVAAAMDDPLIGGLHRSLRMGSYRIVEEAVSNAMEHSESHAISVSISSDLDHGTPNLLMQISHAVDAPVTIDEGSGLARMRSRARALGGQVAYSSVDSTFSVRAQLPLMRTDEGHWTQTESRLI